MNNRCSRIAMAIVVALVLVPTLALAQASRSGPTFPVSSGGGSVVMLPDVAHDSVRDRYLSVAEIAHVIIDAQLLNANGGVLANIRVRTGAGTQAPRVAFSPDINNGAGGYLVVWHESVSAKVTQIWGRLISADGALLGGEIAIGLDSNPLVPGSTSNWLMGPSVAYSTGSREFLVAWMGGYTTANDIRFMRLNAAGALLQGTVTTITAGTIDWERDPSVAYNSQQDEFYIAYAGWVNAGNYGFINGQRVKAGTGALIGGATSFGAFSSPLIPSVSYNASLGQYLVGWYNASGGGRAVYGATVNAADGAIVGAVRVLSAYYASYDALDIDYNQSSGDFLLVTHGLNHEDAAVSITAAGVPVDNGFVLTNTPDVRAVTPTGDGNFNPRVAASARNGRYLTVTASKFAAIHGQFAQSAGAGGPPPGPPPPIPRSSDPKFYLDSPAPNSLVQPNFAVAGWSVDLGSEAGAGTGVATVHVWAYPLSGAAPIFVGAANMGVGRPDIAAHFGRGDFANAGFGLSATLPAGSYNLVAFSFSAVAGKFNATALARITVVNQVTAAPNPKMFIDSPGHGSVVQTTFSVGGWAVDLGSTNGPGVNVVHVWAYPSAGSPIFVGATTLNVPRPDVAAHFGGAHFTSSGYSLQGSLPPGSYTLVVFAFSTVSGSFNQAAAVPITVR